MAEIGAGVDEKESHRRQTELSGLLAAEDMLPLISGWRAEGLRTALVTLVAINGPGPRPLGAQMAVAEDGRYAGYLSGGCLERSVVSEAVAAIGAGCNRLVRYGGKDGYFDLALPCGSEVEIYVDQGLPAAVLAELMRLRAERTAVALRTNLDAGSHHLNALVGASGAADTGASSQRDRQDFVRVYRPQPRLLLIGASPVAIGLARVAAVSGLSVDVLTPSREMVGELLAHGIAARAFDPRHGVPADALPDAWSACVLAFHEHDAEPALLRQLLAAPGFYVGALGSRDVHARRVAALGALGVSAEQLVRLKGPIGLIPGAKTQAALALGVLAEIVAAARRCGVMD